MGTALAPSQSHFQAAYRSDFDFVSHFQHALEDRTSSYSSCAHRRFVYDGQSITHSKGGGTGPEGLRKTTISDSLATSDPDRCEE